MINTNNNPNRQFYIALSLIIAATLSRFIPHPFNFTAVGAIALFAGANFRDKRLAYLVPITVMFLSDIFIGFHVSVIPVYACFAFTVWIGSIISRRQNIVSVISGSLFSSIIFFLVTNLPFWYSDLKLYPISFEGTMQSYTMGLPFFKNQVLGDLFYTGLLFGVFHLLNRGELKLNPIKKVR